jgi:hypothetical protein
MRFLHFLSREKKTKQKKAARVPHNPARRRVGRSSRKLARRVAGSDSPRAFFRQSRRCSARDKGKFKTINPKIVFKPPLRGISFAFRYAGGATLAQ